MSLDDDWMARGKCSSLSGEEAERIFFPETVKGRKANISEARAICKACPVRYDCLAYAIAHNVPHGVWGGLSERTRRLVKPSIKKKIRRIWWRRHPAALQSYRANGQVSQAS